MSDSFSIGDYAVIQDSKTPFPKEPGVVVGFVVKTPDQEAFMTFRGDLRPATSAEIAASKITELGDSLVASAETTVETILSESIRAELAPLREQINELRARALRYGVDL
jgi:hypothetical protein